MAKLTRRLFLRALTLLPAVPVVVWLAEHVGSSEPPPTSDGYLLAPPSDRPSSLLWGMPAGAVERESGTIEPGWIDEQFLLNMQTLQRELRTARSTGTEGDADGTL